MITELRKQIYDNMNLKETIELLEIWKTNDRFEWAETTFDVIKEILEKRGVETPEQDEPIHQRAEIPDDSFGFAEVELKIVDDENPPEFYDPLEVIQISKWIERAAKASVVLIVVLGFIEFPKIQYIVMLYFSNDQSFISAGTLISLGILFVGLIFQIAITYFPLRALDHILKILMEMEFNSRKAKS